MLVEEIFSSQEFLSILNEWPLTKNFTHFPAQFLSRFYALFRPWSSSQKGAQKHISNPKPFKIFMISCNLADANSTSEVLRHRKWILNCRSRRVLEKRPSHSRSPREVVRYIFIETNAGWKKKYMLLMLIFLLEHIIIIHFRFWYVCRWAKRKCECVKI